MFEELKTGSCRGGWRGGEFCGAGWLGLRKDFILPSNQSSHWNVCGGGGLSRPPQPTPPGPCPTMESPPCECGLDSPADVRRAGAAAAAQCRGVSAETW